MKYLAFYTKHLKSYELNGEELKAYCPFHDNQNSPAFSVNVRTGLWKCFNGCKGGNFKTFCKKAGVDPKEAAELKGEEAHFEKPVRYVPEKEIKASVARFWAKAGADARAYLKGRGISDKAMRAFGLGLEEDGSRIWIPVRDHTGGAVNVRRYDYLKVQQSKFLNFKDATTENRFWPYGVVQGNASLLLLEGEPDALLAQSLGLTNAVTCTAGAGSWTDAMTRMLAGKQVVICYDVDDAGRKGANDLRRLLSSSADVRLINLPLEGVAKGDFTDYMKTVKNDVRAFIEQVLGPATRPAASAQETTLANSSVGELFDRPVKLRAVVSGLDLNPYMVPKRVKVVCNYEDGSKSCQLCALRSGKGTTEVDVPPTSKLVLGAPDSSDALVDKYAGEWLQIPGRCPGWQMQVQETAPLWEVNLVNDLDTGRDDGEYINKRAYSMVNLKANVPYEMSGVATKDPKNQASLLEILNAQGTQTALETFDAKQHAELLKIWRVK